jgi:glycosyltransferase domain-containing protein
MDFTLLIPTKNRFYYLYRTINYYSDLEFKGTIIIIDSSDNQISKKNKDLLTIFKNLKLEYFYYDGMPWQVIQKVFPFVNTNFVSFTGDDDYLVPDIIEKGITFLQSNSEFIAVNGEALCAVSQKNRAYIDYFTPYALKTSDKETSNERVFDLMENYTLPLFSIHRSPYFEELLSLIPDIDQNQKICPVWEISDEILPASISVALGKAAKIDGLFLVRGIHNERIKMPSMHENIGDLNIAINYYKNCMVKIFEKDNLTRQKAQEAANQIEKIILKRKKSSLQKYKANLYYFLSFLKKALFRSSKSYDNKKFYLNDYKYANDLEKICKSITS